MQKLTNFCNKLVQKYLPDPFIFALILTAIVWILGIAFNHETPVAMIIHWGNGFWGFLGFSMQMVLVVVLGNVLASAPIFKRILSQLASIPKTPKRAVLMCTLVAGIACMIQWGFGLVIGAIFAKELAKRVRGVDYRLLIASAYSTFLLTIPTSSIILKAASNPDDLVKVTNGVLTDVIPVSRTAYALFPMIGLITLLVVLLVLNPAMHPDAEHTICIDPSLLVDEPAEPKIDRNAMSPAERLENSHVIAYLTFAFGVVYLIWNFFIKKNSLSIDSMNLILLFMGILLHGTPMAYIKALGKAIGNSAGIILQFPFYAGIMGMMTGLNAEGISLAGMMSQACVSFSNEVTFPLFTYLSAGLVNMFVPSAGGQWGVQAPVMFPAGQTLGVDPAITTVALCYGDTWTNMIQPFWALPALGIAGLKVRDIMGFCVIITVASGIVFGLTLLGWALFI